MTRHILLGTLITLLFVACQPTGTLSAIQATSEIVMKGILIEPEGFTQRIHDPVIAYDEGVYYVFSTGSLIPSICSKDKVTWEFCGRAFKSNPAWTRAINPNLTDIWAPDISFFNNRWHLYYAVSSFGTQESAIALATNATLDPESPA
jgi:arabinan endo-1,5-alpha-L-arabinosidase